MPDHVDAKYEWDEEKSDEILAERGFDFEFASRIFDDDNYTEKEDDRYEYGEERSICTGRVNGLFITCSAHAFCNR